MGYDILDLGSELIERLKKAGYKVHFGDGYNTVEGDDPAIIELPDSRERTDYNPDIDGLWFTWNRPDGKGDVEVGETYDNPTSAWGDAMHHWFNNAAIPFDEETPKLPEAPGATPFVMGYAGISESEGGDAD
jgi:hypothetical protein